MLPAPRLVLLAIRLLRVVPAAPVRMLARLVGHVAYAVAGERRRTLIENARWLAPNETPRGQRRLARRTFVNLFDAVVDVFRLPSLEKARIAELIMVHGREHLDAAFAVGRGVIFATLHLGPYELGGAWLAVQGYPVHGMAEDLDPGTNAALMQYRSATGMQVISRSAGARALLRLLRDRQMVLLVSDRVVGPGSDGVEVTFGSGRRMLPAGPAALALTTGAPLLVGYVVRNRGSGSRYVGYISPPVMVERSGDGNADRAALTREVAALLSQAAASHPDEWYVFQPEWQTSEPGTRG